MKKVARIVSTKRARNSVNGNPRWYVHLSDGTQYHTLPDASLAYGINNSDMKGDLVITIENDQITYAEPVERCQVCSEFITRTGRHSWTHTFGGIYCGTGDGATATPK